MKLTFSQFNKNFYSRIPDLSVFDCEEYNLLKVVLDGLKVDYQKKGIDKQNIFKSSPVSFLLRLARTIKHASSVARAKKKCSEVAPQLSVPYLLFDNGRMAQKENAGNVSYNFDRIEKYLGSENCITIYQSKTELKKGESIKDLFLATLFSNYSGEDRKMINHLKTTYSRIENLGVFDKKELFNIRVAINKFFDEYRFWRFILRESTIKYALFQGHYHQEGFILALKRKEIQAIELQHGLIAAEDIFYVFPKVVQKIASKSLFSDKIFTYGSYWSDVLQKGFEFTDQQTDVLGVYQESNTYVESDLKKKIDDFVSGNRVILVTTQTFLHSYFGDYVAWLSEDLERTNSQVKIIVKNHPAEKASDYESIANRRNVLLIAANTEYLLSICDWHVSCYSTTLYDATKYNCSNFSLYIEACSDYTDTFIKEGISQLIRKDQNPTSLPISLSTGIKFDKKTLYEDFDTYKHKLKSLTHTHMNNRECKTCSRCILDSKIDKNITFDPKGVCNYCQYYDRITTRLGSVTQKKEFLTKKIEQIKQEGVNKKFDCILGVSGGVDSSYLAYWAKQNGLRPLIVHFDNGWNSELAVKNIQQICERLGFSLHTYVINWEEFKQLQLAYLRAGVIDIEVLTDHAIYATIFKIARQNNLRYTINGFNYATEAIMPRSWVFDKSDFINIKDINRKFGKTKIKTFPHITFFKKLLYSIFFKMESIQVLNYLDYNKEEAKKVLIDKLGWSDYGGKHYESVFTKFYQTYILPKKFNVDKRVAHLATLVCSGQLTKQQAYEELQRPLIDPVTLKSEKEYVVKKLGLTESEFDAIMNEKPRKHSDFKTEKKMWDIYFGFLKIIRPWKR